MHQMHPGYYEKFIYVFYTSLITNIPEFYEQTVNKVKTYSELSQQPER